MCDAEQPLQRLTFRAHWRNGRNMRGAGRWLDCRAKTLWQHNEWTAAVAMRTFLPSPSLPTLQPLLNVLDRVLPMSPKALQHSLAISCASRGSPRIPQPATNCQPPSGPALRRSNLPSASRRRGAGLASGQPRRADRILVRVLLQRPGERHSCLLYAPSPPLPPRQVCRSPTRQDKFN